MDRTTTSQADLRGIAQAPRTVLAVLMLIGFTAVIAQIVLMRELMVVFCGNEMSLGLMLASWLLWTAIGSSGLGWLASRALQARRLMALLEVLVALTFPLAILLARVSKAAFQSVPGEILGPGPMILTSLVVLSAFCLLSGGLFAVGSRLFAQEAGTSTLAGTSNVYLLEALGSGLGGILASLLLIRYLTSFQIAALLCLLNFSGAASLAIPSGPRRRAAGLALVGIFALLVFPLGCTWLEKMSLQRLWSGFDLVASRNSVYGNLAVVQTEATRSLFENGLVAFNVPDPAAAEEAVHFALLQHPVPKSLLLIGGGVNGSLSQALQHPSLERIDYLELDPAVLDLAQEYFPVAWAALRADPRVHVHSTDGRLFLRTTNHKFDVLIVNLPEPQTAQLNRFYTLEFFREAASKLNPGGVFSFQLKASEDYISPDLSEFLRCIDKTLRQVFPEVVTIPGDTVHFFAAARAGSLTNDSQELIARLRSRHIRTSYVREYYLPYRMMPDRVHELESQIVSQAETRTNRDFTPIAYYFDVALWSTRFNGAYRRVFQTMAAVRFGPLATWLALALFGLVALLCWLPAAENRSRASAGFCVAAMGFTLIGLEMLLLLAFQAIYGYVYQQLAIIIAGFMMGMTLGSRRGLRAGAFVTGQRDARRLFRLQLLAALSPVLLYVLFDALVAMKNPATVFLASQILFPLLAVLCGLVGGYQFPVATRVFFTNSNHKASSPGTLYALDLAGACIGAIVLSSYLVPVFGFRETVWLMAVVNLAPAVLAGLLTFGKQAVPA
ncbi:MAG: fused MFS/spermidine synthase [Candidatus Acidiferrales bacterium]